VKKRLFFQLVLPAGALASIIAVLTGDQQAVSLQVWLGAFVIGVAVTALLRLRDEAPFAPVHPLRIATRSVDRADPTPAPVRRVRIIEGWVLRSRDNPRTFAQQLQPELVALAHHFLGVNYGIDFDRYPDRVQAVLGDLGWLVEAPDGKRCPTVDELERFIDTLTIPRVETT